VEICPAFALEYMEPQFPQHLQRIHPDEKADCLAERLSPLPRNEAQVSPEKLFGWGK
jgi:hypothetical protein